MWYPLYLYHIKMLAFERVLQGHLFHLLPNCVNPFTSSRKNPLASRSAYMMGNFTLSRCYVSSPLTQEVTFLSCFERVGTIHSLKLKSSYSLLRRTQDTFPPKTRFLHILTTIKSEGALTLTVCHNINWQQFFLVANKIMMYLIITGLSNTIKQIS